MSEGLQEQTRTLAREALERIAYYCADREDESAVVCRHLALLGLGDERALAEHQRDE